MNKILVPTDFSQAAEGAYAYAIELAGKLDARLEVMHVFHATSEAVSLSADMDFEELRQKRAVKLEAFVGKQRKEGEEMNTLVAAAMVDQSVVIGFAAESIVEASKRADIDLIVMGTKGQRRFMDRLFGTVSSFVAQNAHCPVIILPEGVPFLGLHNILYASNYDSADDLLLKSVVNFAGHFNTGIHLVHVHDKKEKGSYEMQDLLIEQLFRKKAPALEFKISSVSSDTVWSGLFRYATEQSIDLIALVTRHRSFWDKLMHKSLTREMVLKARFPILVLHVED